jgi:hypothetical protein
MTMNHKTHYNVTLRRQGSSEEETLLSIARDPESASTNAIERARGKLKVMADREYAQFDVVSCVVAPARSS